MSDLVRYWFNKEKGLIIDGMKWPTTKDKIEYDQIGSLYQIYFSDAPPFKEKTLKTGYFDKYNTYRGSAKIIRPYEWGDYRYGDWTALNKAENNLLDRFFCTLEDTSKVLDISDYLIR